MAFSIRYGERAQAAIAAMSARERSIVIQGIRAHLAEEPLRQARNRKPMRPSPAVAALGITWELRIAGVWRVFYAVDAEVVTVGIIDIARKGRETTEEILADDDEEKNP